MEDNQETRAEWQRLTVDMLMEEPPLSEWQWRRQMAVETILARLLEGLAHAGHRELKQVVLHVPPEASDILAYANVFRRIAFIAEGFERSQ